ncbi:MAG: glycosyltransferase [Bacilli bacterium]
MEKMKILEVISSLAPTGGGETFAVNLSRELSSQINLKVVILYQKNRDFFIERLKEKKIEPIILNKKGHVDLKNTRDLRKIIDDFAPDIIHTENNALISTFLALRKTKHRRKLHVFHTMHLIPEEECKHPLVRMMYKYIFRKKNYVPVAITKRLAEISSKFYRRSFVPFVNNGVELSPFNNHIKLEKREYDIVVVGRFSVEKNHKFLIPAFAKLKESIPNLKVALVGDGEMFNEALALAKALKTTEYMEFKGILNNPAEVVNDAKVIALGSLFEANPLSLIEGMSSGCIVVSSDVGGVADIIQEGKNGFLFPVNEEEKFIAILKKVLKNISNYETMSSYNRKYSQQFSMKKCANDYIELFRNYEKNIAKPRQKLG